MEDIEKTKKRVCNAIVSMLNKWLGDEGVVSVINSHFMWFACDHRENAELKALKDVGIRIPEYYNEKHWVRGRANFDFFLKQEQFDKISERTKRECEEEKRNKNKAA